MDVSVLTPDPERRCRKCGCTENDCSQCVAKTGQPCFWVAQDLCSACRPAVPQDVLGRADGMVVLVPHHAFTGAVQLDIPGLPLVVVSRAFSEYVQRCRELGGTEFDLPPELGLELGWAAPR